MDNAQKDVEASKTYTITIEAKRIKGEKNGKKYDFIAYSGFDTKGKKCKFKFTKEVDLSRIDDEGIYNIDVLSTKINRDKSSKFNEYWIRGIEKSTEYDGFSDKDNADLPF